MRHDLGHQSLVHRYVFKYRIDAFELLVAEHRARCGQLFVYLAWAFGAGQQGGHRILSEDPREGKLHETDALVSCDAIKPGGDLQALLEDFSLEAVQSGPIVVSCKLLAAPHAS